MSGSSSEEFKMVAVYRADNESVAEIVRGILESEGIPVTFTSTQVPMYDGIMKLSEGYWGDLLVPESQAEHAREVIQAYENK